MNFPRLITKNTCLVFILVWIAQLLISVVHAQDQDSLYNIIRTRNDSNAVNAFYQIGRKYYVDNQLDSAQTFFENGLALADQIEDHQRRVSLRRSLSIVVGKQGNISKGHDLIKEALTIIDEQEMNETDKIDILINEGALYLYENDLGRATMAFSDANDLARKHQEDAKRSMLLNNLGILYRRLERYDAALLIYEESFAIRNALNDSMGMANLLMNMSAAYAKTDSASAALRAIGKAEELFRALDSQPDILLCELSQGIINFDLGNDATARRHLEPLTRMADLPFDPEHTIQLHLTLARIELKAGNYRLSEYYLDRIDSALANSDFNEYQMIYYRTLSQIQLHNQAYEEAAQSLENYVGLADDFYAEEEVKLRSRMETQFLTKEKDYKINLLNAENELADIRLKTSRFALGASLVGIAILSLLLYRLIILNKKVKKTAGEKDTLLREIHHRVKNNLQVISALLTLQSSYLKDAEAKEALKQGQDRVASMALIHKDLYQHDNLKGVNTRDYLQQLTSNLIDSYKLNDEITIKTNIEEIQLDVDTMIPMGLMVNELISNALKHAFQKDQKGKIEINLAEEKDTLVLTIRDNGQGITDQQILKHKSFGYSLVQSFARKLNANILFQNEDGLAVIVKIKNYQKA